MEKKNYATPKLECLGTVGELTAISVPVGGSCDRPDCNVVVNTDFDLGPAV